MDTLTKTFRGMRILHMDRADFVDSYGYYRCGIYTAKPGSWTVARYNDRIEDPIHAEYVVNTFRTKAAAIVAVELLLA